ncbi:hypothetical protein JIN85_19800 [Luteolibacter pohnpeiensis]|uniref:Uncharacterized protein n=1 Tax=Luteolibacter pohnpeiensis TaxID=454153 RepID=A0A934S7T1_9BACT|nr:hypothetical protein [Luteolibacter pohnpeiensis]MBK1884665.1 hypothetical protein [Luteolibacter pohnpeiensis]
MMKPITPEMAKRQSMVSVTSPYLRTETDMLEKAVAQFVGCNIALVETGHGIEIWRVKSEVKEVKNGN